MQDASCIEGKLYLNIEGDVWLTSFYYYPLRACAVRVK